MTINLEGRIEKNMKRYEMFVVVGDQHIPFHDKKTVRAVNNLIGDYKPAEVVMIGDYLDFYDLSTFDKDPDRMFKLQKELDVAHSELEKMITKSPESRYTFLEGNHEARLIKYLRRNPELYSLRVLNVPNLLGLKDLGVKHYDVDDDYVYKNFLFTHGDVARKHSAYTAKAHLENQGISGIAGHTHRGGSHYKTDLAGVKAFYENFCMCDLHPVYTKNPNWQQGFSVVWFKKGSNRFHVEQIPIINNKFVFGGVEYK